MPFAVLQYTLCGGWEDCWTVTEADGTTHPERFATELDALAELEAHLEDDTNANPEEYRVVEVPA